MWLQLFHIQFLVSFSSFFSIGFLYFVLLCFQSLTAFKVQKCSSVFPRKGSQSVLKYITESTTSQLIISSVMEGQEPGTLDVVIYRPRAQMSGKNVAVLGALYRNSVLLVDVVSFARSLFNSAWNSSDYIASNG